MSSFLKGNYGIKKNIGKKEAPKENLESRFEREALKHLGGSIAFEKKKKIDFESNLSKLRLNLESLDV